jgi:hypothetical protein
LRPALLDRSAELVVSMDEVLVIVKPETVIG